MKSELGAKEITGDNAKEVMQEAEKAIFDGKLLMAMASSVNEIRCLEIAAIMDGIKKVLIERKPISAVFPSTALKEGE